MNNKNYDTDNVYNKDTVNKDNNEKEIIITDNSVTSYIDSNTEEIKKLQKQNKNYNKAINNIYKHLDTQANNQINLLQAFNKLIEETNNSIKIENQTNKMIFTELNKFTNYLKNEEYFKNHKRINNMMLGNLLFFLGNIGIIIIILLNIINYFCKIVDNSIIIPFNLYGWIINNFLIFASEWLIVKNSNIKKNKKLYKYFIFVGIINIILNIFVVPISLTTTINLGLGIFELILLNIVTDSQKNDYIKELEKFFKNDEELKEDKKNKEAKKDK